jgi:hypothetical protein
LRTAPAAAEAGAGVVVAFLRTHPEVEPPRASPPSTWPKRCSSGRDRRSCPKPHVAYGDIHSIPWFSEKSAV